MAHQREELAFGDVNRDVIQGGHLEGIAFEDFTDART
jgi:hypothetical protein